MFKFASISLIALSLAALPTQAEVTIPHLQQGEKAIDYQPFITNEAVYPKMPESTWSIFKSSPLKVKIAIRHRDTGLVGQDGLQLGKLFGVTLDPFDSYVKIIMIQGDSSKYILMPLSLIKGLKEGQTLVAQMNDEFVELTASQQALPGAFKMNFETALESLITPQHLFETLSDIQRFLPQYDLAKPMSSRDLSNLRKAVFNHYFPNSSFGPNSFRVYDNNADLEIYTTKDDSAHLLEVFLSGVVEVSVTDVGDHFEVRVSRSGKTQIADYLVAKGFEIVSGRPSGSDTAIIDVYPGEYTTWEILPGKANGMHYITFKKKA